VDRQNESGIELLRGSCSNRSESGGGSGAAVCRGVHRWQLTWIRKKFFDRVNHNKLMARIAERVSATVCCS
jgi:retron-type reverse transcriptase